MYGRKFFSCGAAMRSSYCGFMGSVAGNTVGIGQTASVAVSMLDGSGNERSILDAHLLQRAHISMSSFDVHEQASRSILQTKQPLDPQDGRRSECVHDGLVSSDSLDMLSTNELLLRVKSVIVQTEKAMEEIVFKEQVPDDSSTLFSTSLQLQQEALRAHLSASSGARIRNSACHPQICLFDLDGVEAERYFMSVSLSLSPKYFN